MSHHQGIICDACMKENFKGRRFRCLKCFDYDLCANCYDAGATSPEHLATHPMQCILTHSDLELYFGGETDQRPALTCPFCGCMGFTEPKLARHVFVEHPESGTSLVVCPICVVSPGGDATLLHDDFLDHLRTEHRATLPTRSFSAEPDRNYSRRPPQTARRGGVYGAGREIVRRSNFSGDLSQFSEIRGTLSNSVPRFSAAATQSTGNLMSHIRQLQQDIRQQELLEHNNSTSRRQGRNISYIGTETETNDTSSNLLNDQVVDSNSNQNRSTHNSSPQFLLQHIDVPLTESEKQQLDVDRADRSLFIRELFFSMLKTPITTDDEKDQSPLVKETQPQVPQTLTKPKVPNAKHQQTNKLPSPPLTNQSQQSSHEGDLHSVVSPPVMQSKIPQLAANVRKQPKVTDP